MRRNTVHEKAGRTLSAMARADNFFMFLRAAAPSFETLDKKTDGNSDQASAQCAHLGVAQE